MIPGWNGEDDNDCEGCSRAVVGHRAEAVKGNKEAEDYPEEVRQRIIHQEDRARQQKGRAAKKAGYSADASAQGGDGRLA